jgi:hypothetical protein
MRILADEAAQEQEPPRILEIVLSLAAGIHEQKFQAKTQVSAAPAV